MNKIIWIWDLHWNNTWEKIVKYEEDADKIIFVWDYFDSYKIPFEKQKENFLKIMEFKKKNNKKVNILLGNHEVHYLSDDKMWWWYNLEKAQEIKSVLEEYIDELEIAVCVEYTLFSHAWISKTWLSKIKPYLDPSKDLYQEINRLFLEVYKQKDNPFSFYEKDETKWDNVNQWVLRIRPESLSEDALDWYTQVVWHSYVDINTRKSYKKKWLYFIDNFVTNFWSEKNERNYYLKIEKNEKSWEYDFKEIII